MKYVHLRSTTVNGNNGYELVSLFFLRAILYYQLRDISYLVCTSSD